MSHSKERTERVCLNCQTEMHGLYCHVCGQENREPKESVWSLISHFFHDLTHFDGKFFNSVKFLIWKPGFLSKEYLSGRRASYLNPVRMYVFTSAVFFLIFFTLFNSSQLGLDKDRKIVADSVRASADSIIREKKNRLSKKDSQELVKWFPDKRDTNKITTGNISSDKGWNIQLTSTRATSKYEYDSIQKLLPVSKKDGWFTRKMNYRNFELKKRYKENSKEFLADLLDSFIHMFPYLLFVSLPLYALFLKLLFIRRKQFYYTDHGIFLLHLYIFSFLLMLVYFGLLKLENISNPQWTSFVKFFLFMYGIVYTIKAMRNFYRQGWGKTIFKFIILNILAFFSLIALFAFFGVLTIFSI